MSTHFVVGRLESSLLLVLLPLPLVLVVLLPRSSRIQDPSRVELDQLPSRSAPSLVLRCSPVHRLGQPAHVIPPSKRVEPVLGRELLRLGLGCEDTDGEGS
jgi:hypothetical protein